MTFGSRLGKVSKLPLLSPYQKRSFLTCRQPMHNQAYRHILYALLLWATSGIVMAQQRPYGEVGIAVGGMNYIGDLNNQSMLGRVNMAGEVFFRYNINNRWAVHIGGAYGHIEGGNPDVQPLRNLSFRSAVWEGSVRAEFNFVSFGLSTVEYPFTPYLFAGLGVLGFNPKAQYTDPATGTTSWVALEPLGTEGQHSDLCPDVYPYNLLTVCMPFGLGFKFRPSKVFSVAIEYGFRKTWTDYLDDVSTVYVDPAVFADNPTAAALYDRAAELDGGTRNSTGTQRGDDSLNDWYSFFNVSIAISGEILFGWTRSKRCTTD